MGLTDDYTPAEMVQRLMESEGAPVCKAGYSHESAVLAVRDLYGLDDGLTDRLRRGTDPDVPCTVETWRGYPC